MCENFMIDFAKKAVKYNCCTYCVKRFNVCKNLDSFYNHINPNHLHLLLRNCSSDKDDIDTLLTALHTDKQLHYFLAGKLVRFIYDFGEEEYIIKAIKEHLSCINDDYMPHIELLPDNQYRLDTKPIPNSITFTEWLKRKIFNSS